MCLSKYHSGLTLFSSYPPSGLATRAEIAGALPLDQVAYGCAASLAIAFVGIDLQCLAEIARFAVNLGEILQSSATLGDGRGQRCTYRRYQPGDAFFTDTSGRAGRAYTGKVKRFAGVNIAYTDNNVAIHNKGLDGGAASAATTVKIVSVEFFGERLRPEWLQQAMLQRIVGAIEQGTKTSRIAKFQRLSIAELQLDVFVAGSG